MVNVARTELVPSLEVPEAYLSREGVTLVERRVNGIVLSLRTGEVVLYQVAPKPSTPARKARRSRHDDRVYRTIRSQG